MKRVLIAAFLIFALIRGGGHAQAKDLQEVGEAYALPTYKEIIQTALLMGGYDIGDTRITDEYAKVMYCDLYKENYKNDFQWNSLRRQIVSRVQEKKEYYRVQYEIHSSAKLERYDFDGQFFPLAKEDRLFSIGSIIIHDKPDAKPFCQDTHFSTVFPFRVVLKLGEPFTFDKIKMPMDEAEHLLKKFENMRDPSRMLYARLRFKVMDVLPEKNSDRNVSGRDIVFLGKLKEVAVFLDKDMTQLVQTIPVEQ